MSGGGIVTGLGCCSERRTNANFFFGLQIQGLGSLLIFSISVVNQEDLHPAALFVEYAVRLLTHSLTSYNTHLLQENGSHW